MRNENEQDRALDQARAQFESIREMVEELESADEARSEDEDGAEARYDEAYQQIQEDALSVEVRSASFTCREWEEI